MKILLINPPAEKTIIGNNPEIIDEERGCNPPLGVLFLAACLEESGRHDVEVLDCQAESLGYDGLAREIETRNPELVGLTAMTLTLVDVVKTAELVKKVLPHTPVVAGGPHAAIYPTETARLESVDYVIQGEAERSIVHLADILDSQKEPEEKRTKRAEAKKNKEVRKDGDAEKTTAPVGFSKEKTEAEEVSWDALSAVPGLHVWRNGECLKGAEWAFIENLDEIPFPARHLTDVKAYDSLLAQQGPVTTMFSSRGCPFRCTFCHRPAMGKTFRAMSANRVVDEMEVCRDLGIKEILIYDDTFTVGRDRVVEICREILRRELSVVWDVRAHINTVDPELLKLMRRAGCARIHYGIEAGTDRVMKVLKKGITLKKAKQVVRDTRRAGISTLAYFMIGNPTETLDEAKQTIRFARSLGADYVHITILTPFPGTPLYEDGLRDGIFAKDHWREFAENPREDFVPPFWEEHMTTAELQGLVRRAYRSFYLRPIYILNRLRELRSLGELKRKARAAWKVMKM